MNFDVASETQTSEGTSGSGEFAFVAQYFTDNTYTTSAPANMQFVVGGKMFLGIEPTTGKKKEGGFCMVPKRDKLEASDFKTIVQPLQSQTQPVPRGHFSLDIEKYFRQYFLSLYPPYRGSF